MTGIERLRACLTAGLLFASLAQAQPGLPPGVRGPGNSAATRSVSRYLDLERSLQEAMSMRDRAAAQALLAEDFEARTGSQGAGTGAAKWIGSESGRPIQRVRELDVREFDDIAVVSFLLQGAKQRNKAPVPPTLAVVDIWRRSSGKLLARYTERPAHPPVLSDRPSGRE